MKKIYLLLLCLCMAFAGYAQTCPAVNIPYVEDFTMAVVPALPPCTSGENAGSGNNWTTVSNTNSGFSGPRLRYVFNATNDADAWFYTQGLNLVAGISYRLVFKYGNNNTAYTESMNISYGNAASSSAMTNALVDYPAITGATPAISSTDFTPTVTGIYYIGFHVYSPANQKNLFVDDIAVNVTPTCEPPTLLPASNITGTGATLTWNPPTLTTPSAYDIYFSTSATAPTGATTPTNAGIASTTYNLATLSPAMKYYYWIRSNCGAGGLSAWSVSDSFYTLCSAANVPYTQDFETAMAPALPNCTSSENVGTGNDWVTESSPGDGFTSNTLEYAYNSTAPADTWFYTQGLNLTAGVSYRLTFKYGNNSTTYVESLNVNYGMAASASAMTDQLADYPAITGATPAVSSTDFTPSATGVYYIGFHAYSIPDQYNLYVDDITVKVTPTCEPPTLLPVTNITNAGATINWNSSASSPVGYDVYYSTSSTAPASATTPTNAGISNTSLDFTTLMPATQYYYWIRSNCGAAGLSDWSVADSFFTLCNAINVPYTQDFETAMAPALPNCTSSENVGTGNDWVTESSPGDGFTSNTLEYAYNSTAPADTWFYTQGLNLTAGVSYRLTFKYGNNSTTYVESLNVNYGMAASASAMTDQLANYPAITGATPAVSSTDFTPSATGVYYIGFHAYSIPDQYNLYVDDITVKVTPTCEPPTLLPVTNITLTGATITWDPPVNGSPSDYDAYYSTSSTPPTAATIPTNASITNTTFDFTTLQSSTQYYYWVRSYCGTGGYSEWSVADSFYTLCDAANVPYTQNFQSAAVPALPGCTTSENVGTGNDWITETNPGSGFTSKTLEYSYNSISQADAWFYTRGVNLAAGISYRLTFKYGNDDNFYTESMNVSYGNAASASAMNDLIIDYPAINSGAAATSTTDFTPAATGVYYIGFHAYSIANQSRLLVDNISLALTPAAPVTLLNFKGERQGARNMLTWNTATEQNNKGFELQHSANGQDFSTVSFVKSKSANGNSVSMLAYSFADEKPFAGNTWYRLRQVDIDGKAALSDIVLVKGTKVNALVISSVYPNPAKDQLKIILCAPAGEKVSVCITDMAGKVLIKQIMQLVIGDNNNAVNVSKLPAGTYMIKAMCGNGCETSVSKFVKE